MKTCALCKKPIEIDRFFSRKALCPGCGGDLHICLNCKFHSETSHNRCLEPKAEFQRTRDKANFCDYFIFIEDSQRRKESSTGNSTDKDRGNARKRFDELFKN